MIHSKAFTPATLQQNDTSFDTEPHGFSRSADGGGVHSSGDWLAPHTGITDIFNDLRHAIVEIVSKHWLHNPARGAWAVRSRSPSMQDKHNDDIMAATKSFLQSEGFHPNLSVHPNQPFRLGLIRHLLQLICKTQTLASSTLLSQVSTWVCSNQYGSLVSGAANKPKREKICLGKSTTRTGSQPKKTRTPCLDSSKRTSTPSSCRCSTVTLHKTKSVGHS